MRVRRASRFFVDFFYLNYLPNAHLQKGELIIKNPTAIALGMGEKYKKIRVSHLISKNKKVLIHRKFSEEKIVN